MTYLAVEPSPLPTVIYLGPKYSLQNPVLNFYRILIVCYPAIQTLILIYLIEEEAFRYNVYHFLCLAALVETTDLFRIVLTMDREN